MNLTSSLCLSLLLSSRRTKASDIYRLWARNSAYSNPRGVVSHAWSMDDITTKPKSAWLHAYFWANRRNFTFYIALFSQTPHTNNSVTLLLLFILDQSWASVTIISVVRWKFLDIVHDSIADLFSNITAVETGPSSAPRVAQEITSCSVHYHKVLSQCVVDENWSKYHQSEQWKCL